MEKIKFEDCHCDEQSEPQLMTVEIPIGGQRVTVDIKTRICLKCGEKYFDGRTILNLEKEIRAKSAKKNSWINTTKNKNYVWNEKTNQRNNWAEKKSAKTDFEKKSERNNQKALLPTVRTAQKLRLPNA